MQLHTTKNPEISYKPLPLMAQKILCQNFDLVDVLALPDYDSKLDQLYQRLNTHADFSFAANQRLLILHNDLDYYPSMDSVGNNIYNLLQIISYLNISTDHMVILSNSIGLASEIDFFSQRLNLTAPKVIDFACWYWVYPEQLSPPETSVSPKQFLYTCLNGVRRSHRATVVALLHKYNLEKEGLLSYHNHSDSSSVPLTTDKQLQAVQLPGRCFRTTWPFTRYNDDLSLCPRSKILQVQYATQLAGSIKHPAIVGQPNDNETRFWAPWLNQSLVYVITESVGDYPYPCISEKTWKAIVNKMPFMLVGSQHSLQTLRHWGFKTFSDFWNENYDTLSNVYDRADCVIQNLLAVKDQDWDQLYQAMLPILEHNFNHLSTFRDRQLEQLKHL